MSLGAFLLGLFDTGQIELPDVEPLSTEDVSAATTALQSFEADYRLSLAGEAPRLDLDTALWSATVLYRAAQMLLFRSHDADSVDRLLSTQCLQRDGASAHYSVDLTMRFLPDLVRLARSVMEDDPLVTHLLAWASDWPLSSVGIERVPASERIADVLDHPSLLQLYVDRIIERRDISRLSESRVAEAVRQALGSFPELAPEISSALATQGQ